MPQLEVISQHPAADAHPTPILCLHGNWHAAWIVYWLGSTL
jgi:hypothetical protein